MLFFIFFLLCAVECLGIFGARRATTSYPFFVVVRVQQEQQTVFCGGTIIDTEAILTAAHCLFDYDSKRWIEREKITVIKSSDFTKKEWIDNVEMFSCKRYFPHKSFKPRSYYSPFDVAVVRLKQCVNLNTNERTVFDWSRLEHGVLKPCPPSMKNSEGVALGIGMIQKNPVMFPYVLAEAKLKRYYDCATLSQTHGIEINNEAQVCYGNESEFPASMTEGDAGGPLVAFTSSGESACLIGVSSFGEHSVINPRFPSVFTRVDKLDLWIQKLVLAIHRKPSSSCSVM